ncbi:DgyrCDS13745 [Dimorphilus gyrociliatus]|nr:DgyrCDS13745 [Dimorphilus gyrociliatus]
MKLEAVRADRMRGGRNKFGPMYKRDRALKQQALRQRQHFIQYSSSFPLQIHPPPPVELTPDIKPDIKPDLGQLCPSRIQQSPIYEIPHPPSAYQEFLPPEIHQPPGGLHRPIPDVIHLLTEACCNCESSSFFSCLSSTIEQELMKWVTTCSRPIFVNENNDLSAELINVLCKLTDVSLFKFVEWARQTVLFKELNVEDQMKLLQKCWSQSLLLNFLIRQAITDKCDELLLVPGHSITFDFLNRIGLRKWTEILWSMITRWKSLRADEHEIACLRFYLLFCGDHVTDERVKKWRTDISNALRDYTYPGKFEQMLCFLEHIEQLAGKCEFYLFQRHLKGDVPCGNNLLIEMLHCRIA